MSAALDNPANSFVVLFVSAALDNPANSFDASLGIIVPDVFGTKISGPPSPTIDGSLTGGSPPSLKPSKPLKPRIIPGPIKGLVISCAKPAAPRSKESPKFLGLFSNGATS